LLNDHITGTLVSIHDFSSLLGCRPVSTLCPYTTLFRSDRSGPDEDPDRAGEGEQSGEQHAEGQTRHGDDEREQSLPFGVLYPGRDRKSTRLNSSHVSNSYAVFCLKKKNREYIHNEQHGG